ncbi:MAG: peptide ABC transporter substrate-binding protein [Mesorhizobium sp.]|uniref:ABC transporter substrate-binding protein n=1 Tax=Mesorhizobium sp. TaxID=1871066 RepID=UPI000FE6489C|nr:ABC transporter substrate-binding protein [Mesorhizobium sp.]RWH82170.1 MAG: peptide ABC transporter substrate-binding protein [Mesorhizobium sp.]RWH85171.1 MAG: peptide ABC transporter substrate-binding protein [Mesorhizobium sp.]RWH89926.1 MAG: peptide ABC transporter substrate-binding protein [Mesorhizobium sp.]RWH98324.1 MAG: peptide ABC transporter substrate-binding protein [Mesorhizobium sp.]RWI04668.1 MAG: peptide ABC transporter substrate-binding protein [Mesorhizobium sp.]
MLTGINRRQLIKTSAATAALVGLGFNAARAQTPKRGGHLRLGIGHGSATDTLDPATFPDAYMQLVGYALRSTLTEVLPSGEIGGDLAERWDVSKDAKTWTFQLHKGVEFHDGKPLRATDVVASINHHRGEKSTSAGIALVEPIEDIKADGESVVVFTLKESMSDFDAFLSVYFLSVMPSKDGTIDWKSGIGTGGYKLVRFEPGVRTALERNPNYFRPDRAFFDSADVLCIKDATARVSALLGGTVDVIDSIDPKTVNLLSRSSEIQVEEASGSLHYAFPMRCDTAPFNDVNVRLAIKYGVDREALVKTILQGHGYVGNDHPIGRKQKYFAVDLPQRVYDPEKGRFHLKKAGMDALKVELTVSEAAFPGAVDTGTLLREQESRAGIELAVSRVPSDGYWSDIWMKKPWCASYWSGGVTPNYIFSHAYSANANWNEAFWQNEQFNMILIAARSELDEAKRGEMYGDLQRLVSDDGGALIPMFANFVTACSNKVSHGEVASNYELDGTRAIERWWFA